MSYMQTVNKTKKQPSRFKSVGLFIILSVLIIALSVISLSLGDINIPPLDIITSFIGIGDPDLTSILVEFRLPRILLAILTGIGLAVSGVVVQSIMRNPLASPDTLGLSSGSGLAAVAVTILMPLASPSVLSAAAFAGGSLVFVIVYLLAYKKGVEPIRFALIGVAVSAFCSSGIHLLISKANPNVNAALIWLSGSLWGRTWDQLIGLLPWVVILVPLIWLLAARLDLIHLGDEVARGLGARVELIRLVLLASAVAMTAAVVSVVGTIGFVGLIIPHVAKRLVGPRHKQLIPTAALLGALFVLAADLIGRGIAPPIEIPAGLIIGIIGAPYFLYLLWRESKK